MNKLPESNRPPDADPAVCGPEVSARKEPFGLLVCPTPGCGSHALRPVYKDGRIEGFNCSNGCRFSVKRNVFTDEIMYYQLDFTILTGPGRAHAGMRFLLSGEPYSEWI